MFTIKEDGLVVFRSPYDTTNGVYLYQGNLVITSTDPAVFPEVKTFTYYVDPSKGLVCKYTEKKEELL